MKITRKAWQDYIDKLRKTSDTAADEMWKLLKVYGTDDADLIISIAFELSAYYGEAAADLACEMYDALAAAYGVTVPPADPAEIDPDTVGRAVRGALNDAPSTVPSVIGRQVKQANADTILQNAVRDGAEFAWIPSGDTCAFCITLASRGWQTQSKKASKAHASHIHNNCDCNYAVRFDKKGGIGGYDPDKYLEMYENADGTKPNEKINAMRRELYEQNRAKINEQKRAAYAARKEREQT